MVLSSYAASAAADLLVILEHLGSRQWCAVVLRSHPTDNLDGFVRGWMAECSHELSTSTGSEEGGEPSLTTSNSASLLLD
jgi:hypothetical protein